MNIFTIFSDIKSFFSSMLNTVCILLLCFCLAILAFEIKLNNDVQILSKKITDLAQNSSQQIDDSTQKICNEIKTNRDKIHFRYFNITHSLEDIHGVKINTKNGKIDR